MNKRDVFHILGLGLLAAGIYLGFGLSWALIASGILLLLFGVLGRWA